MGCVNSKKALTGGTSTVSPVGPYVYATSSRKRSNGSGRSMVMEACSSSRGHSGVLVTQQQQQQQQQADLKKPEERKKGDLNVKIGLSHRFVEGEQVAAGWPSWLTSFAGEAIHGLVPLKTDSFEKLDKVVFFFQT